MVKALVAGATGFIGGRLAHRLLAEGHEVRCLVRDRGKAGGLERAGCQLHEGDVSERSSLEGAAEGCDVAYYLVHLMGRGSGGGFADREEQAARHFAEAAQADGVARVIYLGGLGDPGASRHLHSRHKTALTLRRHGPPLTYFRAAMVVGPQSESYRTVKYLVRRLPAMIAPGWLQTETQPIGVDDVLAFLATAPAVPESEGREIQIGGPDVTTYGGMLDAMADALHVRRRPRVPFPLLTPRLSSLWIGLVTPVDAGVARPLIESLATKTVVQEFTGMGLFPGISPAPFDEALRRAVSEDDEES